MKPYPILFVLSLVLVSHYTMAQSFSVGVPKSWRSEVIPLPTPFAPGMTFKGKEYLRFAPGMYKPDQQDFFTYSFVFEIDSSSYRTKDLDANFIAYYQGLQEAVLKSKKLKAKDFKAKNVKVELKDNAFNGSIGLGKIVWTEPFVTLKPQTLHYQFKKFKAKNKVFLHYVVSPQNPKTSLWQKTLLPMMNSLKID